jgi:cellulose synthase/poly-beta-1,6-N-acetylglucosamine synthase-like glycosyltransferase
MVMQFLFWLALVLVFHTYLVYPEWMLRRAKRYRNTGADPEEWPRVDLLLAAYNEEEVIEKKIQTCLESDYPADKLRLVIGSDCSSDRTDELVRKWSERDPRVRLHRFDSRTGKPGIINTLVKESDAEILVLSDADTFFEAGMIKALVRRFNDARVGGVQARFISEADPNKDVASQELGYNDRELKIKQGQSISGAVIGAYGACYALRRKVYVPVPKGFLVDDFFIFMKVIEQGYHAVYAGDAVCRLEVSGESKTEFKRKARIGMGNYQNFFALRAFWNPFSSVAAGYYWSHKVLRWFTPFFLLFLLAANAYLASCSVFYEQLFIVQAGIYALWITDSIIKRLGIHIKPLRYLSHFFRMNLALLVGFFRYLKGGSSGTW